MSIKHLKQIIVLIIFLHALYFIIYILNLIKNIFLKNIRV